MEQLTMEQILQHGENTTVEFKSWEKAKSMKECVNLAVDELLAFANSKGGTVYFGVEDDGEVTLAIMTYKICLKQYMIKLVHHYLWDVKKLCTKVRKSLPCLLRAMARSILPQMADF